MKFSTKQRLVSGDNSVKAEIASLESDLKLLISVELEESVPVLAGLRGVRNPLVFLPV